MSFSGTQHSDAGEAQTSLISLCSQVANIANNMDPDQAAPKGSSLTRVLSVCFSDKF